MHSARYSRWSPTNLLLEQRLGFFVDGIQALREENGASLDFPRGPEDSSQVSKGDMSRRCFDGLTPRERSLERAFKAPDPQEESRKAALPDRKVCVPYKACGFFHAAGCSGFGAGFMTSGICGEKLTELGLVSF